MHWRYKSSSLRTIGLYCDSMQWEKYDLFGSDRQQIKNCIIVFWLLTPRGQFHKTSLPNRPRLFQLGWHCQMIWFHKASLTKIKLSHCVYLCWKTNLVQDRLTVRLNQRFSIPVLAPPRSAYSACLSLLTHLIQIISLLEVRSVHELCSDWHAPYTVSIAPYTGSTAPYTVSIAPYTGSIAPYTVSIAPYTVSIAPYTGSIAPYTVSIAPFTGSAAPYTVSIAPYTGSIAPYTGSIAPYTGSIAPYTVSIAPYTVSIAPYTGSIAPYTGSAAPYTGSIAPYTGSIAPYSLSREIRWSLLYFWTFIHGFALRSVFTHGRVWHHIPL